MSHPLIEKDEKLIEDFHFFGRYGRRWGANTKMQGAQIERFVTVL
jgi:hypothetical protein